MMKKNSLKNLFAVLVLPFILVACSSSSGGGGGSGGSAGADLMISTKIDETTGFLVAVDGQNDTAVTNANGVELVPSMGVFPHNGFVYTTGSLTSAKLAKYSFDGTTFKKEAEVVTGENTLPASFIFTSDSKAYVNLAMSGELLVVNTEDLSITQRIDLSSYALGEGDSNPEPADGVVSDGKLYLALAQIDGM